MIADGDANKAWYRPDLLELWDDRRAVSAMACAHGWKCLDGQKRPFREDSGDIKGLLQYLEILRPKVVMCRAPPDLRRQIFCT